MNQEREQPMRVVVTGAASGIGRALCELLVKDGIHVIAVDTNQVGLSTLSEGLGESLSPVRFDVTDVHGWEQRVATWEGRWGPIDGLVCAAGRLSPGRLCDPQLTPAEFRLAFELHATALWAGARAVGSKMRVRGHGSIVAITSNAGSTPRLGMGSYPPSKAAAQMLVRCLALELGPSGVRVNGVAPGSTDTPMLREMLEERGVESLIAGDLATFRSGIPLGRIATPTDVAHAVKFLLGDHARHISGTLLTVDGGATWS